MLALGVYTFADSERGRLAFQHWSLKIGAVLLLTLVFMAWMGEFYIRSDYAHQRLGPYPPRAALEYRQQRPYQGAADMPFELDKPDNVLRVLVLGDSYTYGDGVLAEDRYANQLQAYDTENLEVIVLARNGASTKDELEFWRQNGIQTNPDIVIVGVVTNDPDIGRIKQRALINKPIFANRFNRSQFAFYLDAIKAFPFLRDMSPAPDGLDYGSWQDALYQEENFTIWQTDYLQPLYDEITASGAQAWAYILSHPLNRDIDTSHFTRLEIAFRNAGFQTINLVPVLRERFPNSLDSLTPFCAFPNDCHPNARLHASYAEIMWEDLRPFIPRP